MSPDYTSILSSLLQAVPIWTFVGLGVKYWLQKSAETAHEFKKSLEKQFAQVQMELESTSERTETSIKEIQNSIRHIELKMASSGVDDLRENIKLLHESRVRADMKIDAVKEDLDILWQKHRGEKHGG